MNSKTELEKLAKNIIDKSKIPIDNYSSTLLVLMFISIILTSIRVLQECNKNQTSQFYGAEVRGLGKKRTWFTKMRLKRIVKQQLKYEDYIKYKDQIVSAILDTAENLTDEQMSKILETEV